MSAHSPNYAHQTPQTTDVGDLGEALVARWLQRQGWSILEQQWHCRWGELDLIIGQTLPNTQHLSLLSFVEVKTRRDRNWDEDGKLAITLKKQTKLWKTAQSYLMSKPHLAELPCRFDIALVTCEKLSGAVELSQVNGHTTVISNGYQLTLSDYLIDAFRLE